MKYGNTIQWGVLESLGLPALEHTLDPSDYRREIRVYQVPETVDPARYFVSEARAGGAESVPPSRIRETDLLLHFTLQSDGAATLVYARPEVRAA